MVQELPSEKKKPNKPKAVLPKTYVRNLTMPWEL